jgi:hypothetical protein
MSLTIAWFLTIPRVKNFSEIFSAKKFFHRCPLSDREMAKMGKSPNLRSSPYCPSPEEAFGHSLRLAERLGFGPK